MSADVKELRPKQLWSLNALAHEFDKTWARAKTLLIDVPPDGEIRGHPAWKVSTAAPYLCTPVSEIPEEQTLDDMRPADRLNWIRSERELTAHKVEMRELVPVGEVRETLSDVAKRVTRVLDTLPDVLEREAGIDGRAVEVVVELCDGVRAELHEEMLDGDD